MPLLGTEPSGDMLALSSGGQKAQTEVGRMLPGLGGEAPPGPPSPSSHPRPCTRDMLQPMVAADRTLWVLKRECTRLLQYILGLSAGKEGPGVAPKLGKELRMCPVCVGTAILKSTKGRGTRARLSDKCPTLGFGSGCDLRVMRSSPASGSTRSLGSA